MKFKAKIDKVAGNTLIVDTLNNQFLLKSIDTEKYYSLEIKEYKSKRSIEQNKLLWHNIQLISKELTQDIMKTYCELLERADVKSDFIVLASMDMEKALKQSFRGYRFIKPVQVNGKTGYMFKVYIGSSKFNTKEMTELIDISKDMMAELDLMDEYYE